MMTRARSLLACLLGPSLLWSVPLHAQVDRMIETLSDAIRAEAA